MHFQMVLAVSESPGYCFIPPFFYERWKAISQNVCHPSPLMVAHTHMRAGGQKKPQKNKTDSSQCSSEAPCQLSIALRRTDGPHVNHVPPKSPSYTSIGECVVDGDPMMSPIPVWPSHSHPIVIIMCVCVCLTKRLGAMRSQKNTKHPLTNLSVRALMCNISCLPRGLRPVIKGRRRAHVPQSHCK